jgi:hypothetical protein
MLATSDALGSLLSTESNHPANSAPFGTDSQTACFTDQGRSSLNRFHEAIIWDKLDEALPKSPLEEYLRVVAVLRSPVVERITINVSDEMGWLTENISVIERDFRGQWLLIVGRELAAHDREFGAIRRIAIERGLEKPFLYFVPEVTQLDFIA